MKGTSSLSWSCSRFLQPLQAWALGILGVAGHVGLIPIILDRHWIYVGCHLVASCGILGVGTEGDRIIARPLMVKDMTSTGSLGQVFLRKAASLPAILVLAHFHLLNHLKIN